MTLPLIVALRNADDRERKQIMKIVKQRKKSRADIQTVSAFVHRLGGVDYAREKMLTLANEAATLLAPFPPTPARDALLDLTAFVVARKK